MYSPSRARADPPLVLLAHHRRRGVVGNLSIAGTSDKWAAINEHFDKNIAGVYKDMDCSFDPYPAVGASRDPDAYKAAIDALPPKSAITIFVSRQINLEVDVERPVHPYGRKAPKSTADSTPKLTFLPILLSPFFLPPFFLPTVFLPPVRPLIRPTTPSPSTQFSAATTSSSPSPLLRP